MHIRQIENVLKTAKQFAKGDVYCIVGCGGDRDRTKRPMASVATKYATHAIYTLQIIQEVKSQELF